MCYKSDIFATDVIVVFLKMLDKILKQPVTNCNTSNREYYKRIERRYYEIRRKHV